MLGKLIKHEFKACGRYFLPVYIALLIVFFLNGFTLPRSSESAVSGILVILLVSVTLLFIFINLYVTIKRFASSIYGEEGYLTNTLPVSTDQIIISKALTMLIYDIISVAVLTIAILLIISPNITKITLFNFRTAFDDIMKVIDKSDLNLTYVAVLSIISFLISTVSSTLVLYFAVAVAHLKKCIEHKYIYGFITYFVIYIVQTGITNTFLNHTMEFNPQYYGNDPIAIINGLSIFINNSIIVTTILSLIFGLLSYFGIRYLIQNKMYIE